MEVILLYLKHYLFTFIIFSKITEKVYLTSSHWLQSSIKPSIMNKYFSPFFQYQVCLYEQVKRGQLQLNLLCTHIYLSTINSYSYNDDTPFPVCISITQTICCTHNPTSHETIFKHILRTLSCGCHCFFSTVFPSSRHCSIFLPATQAHYQVYKTLMNLWYH